MFISFDTLYKYIEYEDFLTYEEVSTMFSVSTSFIHETVKLHVNSFQILTETLNMLADQLGEKSYLIQNKQILPCKSYFFRSDIAVFIQKYFRFENQVTINKDMAHYLSHCKFNSMSDILIREKLKHRQQIYRLLSKDSSPYIRVESNINNQQSLTRYINVNDIP